MELISSRQNERVKQVRALRDRRARDTYGTFFAEGRRLVQAAVESGAEIEQLVVAPERLDGDDMGLMETLGRLHLPMLEVTPEVFDSLSFREEGQSLGAVVLQRW